MEPEVSFSNWHQSANGRCSEPDKSNAYSHTIFVNAHFNIFLISAPRFHFLISGLKFCVRFLYHQFI
jgi:hypothetical protein